jgi:hypothetical protein
MWDGMGLDWDETRPGDGILLLLLTAAATLPTRRHFIGSPALVTGHLLLSPPYTCISLFFSYPFIPLSSF